MINVVKTELIELVIPGVAGGQQGTIFKFPDLPKLRAASAMGIEAYNENQVARSPLGNAVIDTSNFLNAYLTLYYNEREDGYRIPLFSLLRSNGTSGPGTNGLFYQLNGQLITWDKSYITFANGFPPGNTNNVSFLFQFYYQ